MSSLLPITETAGHVDFSDRPVVSKTVVASPALAAETTICTVTVPNNVQVISGVRLIGWCAFTMGTSGVSATMKLRETSTSGASVATSGATLGVATGIYQPSIMGFDANGTPGMVYVLTLTIGSGAGASTVSAVFLEAFAY